MFDFLKSITECKDKKVTADPRRFPVVQPPPFAAQLLDAERSKAIDATFDRIFLQFRHA